jgi:diguanylate cyclase (GGDEF)-like protein
VLNYALDGSEVHVLMQFSVLPGHEDDWSLVQVGLTDITARKKAEVYLEYLGTHDVLTKLFNRSFYVEELNRIDRKGLRPVTVIMVDLNGLKATNDQWGHGTGDALLRRVGEVLGEAVSKPHCAARIGGDEFAILLPGVDETGAEAAIGDINRLVDLNNQYYSGVRVSLSIGAATGKAGERLEAVINRADMRMYEAKRAFYSDYANDRRTTGTFDVLMESN